MTQNCASKLRNFDTFWDSILPSLDELFKGHVKGVYDAVNLKTKLSFFLGTHMLLESAKGKETEGYTPSSQSDRCHRFALSLYAYLEKIVRRVKERLKNTPDGQYLDVYEEEWDMFKRGASFLAKLTDFDKNSFLVGRLEIGFCVRNAFELCMAAWRRYLLEENHRAIYRRLQNLIEQCRRGPSLTLGRRGSAVKESFMAVSSIHTREEYGRGQLTSFYVSNLESRYRCDLSEFYKRGDIISKEYDNEDDFLHLVSGIQSFESKLALNFLQSNSVKQMENAVSEILLLKRVGYVEEILTRATRQWDIRKMRNIIDMCGKSFTLQRTIADVLRVVIAEKCKQALKNMQQFVHWDRTEHFVQRAKGLIADCDQMWRYSCSGSGDLRVTIDKALHRTLHSILIGGSDAKLAMACTHLCSLIDHRLRMEVDQRAIEQTLLPEMKQMIKVARYSCTPSDFVVCYKRLLMERLLHFTSASLAVETKIVEFIQEMFGRVYAKTMHKMIKDIEKSKTFRKGYRNLFKHLQKTSAMEIDLKILRHSAWPLIGSRNMRLPPELEQSARILSDHHAKQVDFGLKFLGQESTVELKCNHFPEPLTLKVTLVQASIILLFSNTDKRTVGEILRSLCIDRNEALCSLSTLLSVGLLRLEKKTEGCEQRTPSPISDTVNGPSTSRKRDCRGRISPKPDCGSHLKLDDSATILIDLNFRSCGAVADLTKAKGQFATEKRTREKIGTNVVQEMKRAILRSMKLAHPAPTSREELLVEMRNEFSEKEGFTEQLIWIAIAELEKNGFIKTDPEELDSITYIEN